MNVETIRLNNHEDLNLFKNRVHRSSLVLIRGVSGSGKSTLAKQIKNWNINTVWLEADAWFYENDEGVYKFVPSEVPRAHGWCQNRARANLEIGQRVIVSNTFTREFELEPYIKMARFLNATVLIIDVLTQFGNVHGVPMEMIEKQKARFVPVDCLRLELPNPVYAMRVVQ